MRSSVICSGCAISPICSDCDTFPIFPPFVQSLPYPICSDCAIAPVLSLQAGFGPISDNVALVVNKMMLGQVTGFFYIHFSLISHAP